MLTTVPYRRVAIAVASALLAGCGGATARSGGDAVTVAPEGSGSEAAAAEPQARPAAAKRARLAKIGTFVSPVYVTSPPDDTRRLFVVEQDGRIMVVRGGRKLSTPFLDIRRLVQAGGEQGLLSVAFPPDYASSRRFYVYYTDRAGDQRVVEYRASSADHGAAGSARLVMRMADDEGNHNGGLLLFGPDRLMYIGTGDGGGGGDRHGRIGNAQNLGSPLGKILRIDPRRSGSRAYTIPSGNPFVGRRGARGEVYAYGLRNPWRFSFDRATRALIIGDVGQGAVEEIDYVKEGNGRGANFGWRPFEGRQRYTAGESAPGQILPVIEQFHDDGNCSITGGVVVRDHALTLAGRYVFGDFCKGQIYSARLARPRAQEVRTTGLRVPSLSSFGEDALGRVYAVSLDGAVYRLAPR